MFFPVLLMLLCLQHFYAMPMICHCPSVVPSFLSYSTPRQADQVLSSLVSMLGHSLHSTALLISTCYLALKQSNFVISIRFSVLFSVPKSLGEELDLHSPKPSQTSHTSARQDYTVHILQGVILPICIGYTNMQAVHSDIT